MNGDRFWPTLDHATRSRSTPDLGTPPEGGYWLMTACRKS
jgi:hypothetical protein